MVEESLKAKWEKIVVEQTEGPYVDLNGQRQTAARKKSQAVLEDCYTHFLGLFGPPNSAERIDDDLKTNLVLDFTHCRPGAAVNCIQEISGWMGIIPCSKNIEGSPAQLARFQLYSGYQICQIVKTALPRGLRASYDAIAKTEFECDPKNLIKDLEKAREEHASKKSEMQSLLRTTLEKEIREEYRIPRKERGAANNNNKKTGGGGAAGGRNNSARSSQQKGCERCKKWRPDSDAYKTHATGQCRAFNHDGSRKDGFRMRNSEEGEVPKSHRKRYQNRISAADKESEQEREMQALKKYKKKYEKLSRKFAGRKERKRRARRHRYHSSDEDSASLSSMSY